LAFISFGVSSWTAVAIFERNADYLERLAKGEDCTDPELAKLDRILKRGFFIGVLAAALLGVTSYVSHRTRGDGEMAGKKEQPEQNAPLKKSLDQLNKLNPNSGTPKTGSVDGLNRLKTGPSTTPGKDQSGGKATK
jgi:hypothetical protein